MFLGNILKLSLLWWFPLKFHVLPMWDYGKSSALTTSGGWKAFAVSPPAMRPPFSTVCREPEPVDFYPGTLLTPDPGSISTLANYTLESGNETQEIITGPSQPQNSAPGIWEETWSPLWARTFQTNRFPGSENGSPLHVIPTCQLICGHCYFQQLKRG